jgi:ATP-dependent Clp protease ATP-binding subunit ClpC
MFERFTDRARTAMVLANQEALRFHHECIGDEHILLGLIEEGTGVGATVLKNLGVDLQGIRNEVGKMVKSGPETLQPGKLSHTLLAKAVIGQAIAAARGLNHGYIGTGHLLLGLLRVPDCISAKVVTNLGLALEDVRKEVLSQLDALPSGRPRLEPPPRKRWWQWWR